MAGCAREPVPEPLLTELRPARSPEAAVAMPVDAAPELAPADDRHRLHPAEGTLAIAAPAQVATRASATVTLTLTAGPGFRVNEDFPVRLVLVPPPGLAVAKPSLTRADALASDDHHLVLGTDLVASDAGSYALTGRFKFALCQRDVCFTKDEPIAIQLTAAPRSP